MKKAVGSRQKAVGARGTPIFNLADPTDPTDLANLVDPADVVTGDPMI
jgi:hypothetical protein